MREEAFTALYDNYRLFQPFLRFYGAEPPPQPKHDPMFQPFLRFYGSVLAGLRVVAVFGVSTLLEILREIAWATL